MKISNIRIKTYNKFVSLSADCTIRHFGLDTIYFKFDKKYTDFIYKDASPFAAALLIPAMKLGQDLHIEGAISEQLYRNLHEIMKIVLSWNIGLKPISIFADTLVKDNFNSVKSASFFSGGVDSFYTYLKNKTQKVNKIKYFILANGYDIGLNNQQLWNTTCKTIEDISRVENIEVIKVESNIRRLIEPIIVWDYTHGGCLAALGLSLRKEFKYIFIASSYSYSQLFPWGSHPQIDKLWSTETLTFDHDGVNVSRVEKTKFISKNPLVLKYMRVCYLNKTNKFNCGVCDKCLRTMIALQIAGRLNKSQTFPHKINIEMVKKLQIDGEHGAIFHRENLNELEKNKIEVNLQEVIRNSLKHISTSESRLIKLLIKLRFLDNNYNRGRLYKLAVYARKKLV